ncbi:MAG: hypothetical protein ACHQFX_11835 [Chitinophagales bacterium]
MPNKENPRPETKNVPPYTFKDEVTERKIRRHIKDINDVITEKDIKDAKVPGAEITPVPARPAKPAKKKKNGKDDNVVDDLPGNPATPWDILQG